MPKTAVGDRRYNQSGVVTNLSASVRGQVAGGDTGAPARRGRDDNTSRSKGEDFHAFGARSVVSRIAFWSPPVMMLMLRTEVDDCRTQQDLGEAVIEVAGKAAGFRVGGGSGRPSRVSHGKSGTGSPVRIARQLVNFALGVAVGLCLYFLPQASRVPKAPTHSRPQAAENHSGAACQSQTDQGPKLLQDVVHEPAHVTEHRGRLSPNLIATESTPKLQPLPAEPKPQTAIETVSSITPAPLSLKPLGYVEKADGQLEAIIPQENEVQVVHIGDLISGRYRVTKITPDSVDAVDETLVKSPMTKPGGGESRELTASVAPAPAGPPTDASAPVGAMAESAPLADPALAPKNIGYVQQADGTTDTVIADADTVHLVPETETVAQATQVAPSKRDSGTEALPTSALTASLDGEMQPAPVSGPSDESADSLSGMIHQVSYHVSTPAADGAGGSALRISGASSSGNPVSVDGASESALSFFTKSSLGSAEQPTEPPAMMLPLGYVVKEDGSFAAILSKDGEIYIVGQGDRFAGRYRAISVSADAVEAVEDPPWQAHPPPWRAPPEIPAVLTAPARTRPDNLAEEDCLECKPYAEGEVSRKTARDSSTRDQIIPQIVPNVGRFEAEGRKVGAIVDRTSQASENPVSPDVPTFVFETLGYVQTQDGEMRAIVADESELYLVKQGETFAGQYRAISVDPTLVLAARDPTGKSAGTLLTFQAESQAAAASKGIGGLSQFPFYELANLQALHANRALGNPSITDLGPGFLHYSLTGVGFDSQFLMAGNPHAGF